MGTMPFVVMGGGIFIVLLMAVFAFSTPSGNKALSRRMTAIRDRHDGSTGAAVEAQMRRILASRATRMDGIAGKFLPKPALLRKRLDMTGKNWTMGKYMIAHIIILVVVSGLLLLKGAPFLLAILAGLFLAMFLPHKFVARTINKRVTNFTKKFPDAIELLVRGLRAGLPISETLSVVGNEVPGPVGVEFRSVADKIKIGRTMDVALQETADRLGTPEFQFFCITLNIQRETGGNLAETLSNLSEVLRKRAQMKLKIKAMSSESTASAYIIGSLPFLVFAIIYFINPNYMMVFFTDSRAMVAAAGGLTWMSIGAFIMSRMISFEI